ncbi:MAG: hypothetical protein RL757_1280 [Bacteroidota bacterium]|jgi:uncharacterized membrane-anchored protein
MKKTFLLAGVTAAFLLVATQVNADKPVPEKPKKEASKSQEEPSEADQKKMMDEIRKSFKYETGSVSLGGGMAQLQVPAGFKFLDKKQAQHVVTDIWGNPQDDDIVGMLLPEKSDPLEDGSFAFVISYDEMGFVKDEDADKINYDDLLKEMQSGESESNAARAKQNFPAIHLVRWAAAPFYDKEKKALHWAKELQFGGQEKHTLNYDIRVLGRKGILSFNAIGDIGVLGDVKPVINSVISGATFAEGNRYSDFNPSLDKVAGLTVGGLVAGKVLAKVGVFAFLLKYIKLIFIGVAALGGGLWKRLTGKKDEEPEPEVAATQEMDENGNFKV